MRKDKTREAKVSDHALVRYLDRVMGIDVEGVRRLIAAKVEEGVQLGATAVVAEGMRFLLVDDHVTTVRPCHHERRMPREKDEGRGE